MQQFAVATLVIDALPETTKARELQADFPPGVVWLAYYVSQRTGTKHAVPLDWNEVDGVVNLDRTRTLDALYGRFYAHLHTLPADARELPEYYAHRLASTRVLEDGPGGEKVARYVESGPDHFAHAENYCLVAALAPAPPAPGLVYDDSLRVQIGY
jgi:hypothetical protein